jgi:hypothetical protein
MDNFQGERESSSLKAWGWFIGLALGGLMATATLTYTVKFLIKLLG